MTGAQLAELVNARQTAPDQWIAKCPSHDDRSPSLGIRQVEDRILLKCRAGCQTEAVLAALGLSMRDLFDDDNHHRYRQHQRPARPTSTTRVRSPHAEAPDVRTAEQMLADVMLADPPVLTDKQRLIREAIEQLQVRSRMIGKGQRLLDEDADSELGWALLSEAYHGQCELEHELNRLEGRKT